MANLTHRRTASKSKKSYTLSPETVAFLELMRQSQDADSVSAVLEEILQNARREHERAALGRKVSDYYSSLSDAEMKEQAEWGDFAMQQFPTAEPT